MKSLLSLIMVFMCSILCMSLAACSEDPIPAETTPAPADTDPVPEETEPMVDYGTLTIDDVFAWVGYPDSIFFPVFSNEEYKEALTYEYDTSALTIDAEKNTVTALKKGVHKVTAKSEHFTATFNVRITEVNTSEKTFSAKNFAAAAEQRANIWKNTGVVVKKF